jgi:hypothetical protein
MCVCIRLEQHAATSAASIDVLIRVAQGVSARSNDYAWARISAMCLTRGV